MMFFIYMLISSPIINLLFIFAQHSVISQKNETYVPEVWIFYISLLVNNYLRRSNLSLLNFLLTTYLEHPFGQHKSRIQRILKSPGGDDLLRIHLFNHAEKGMGRLQINCYRFYCLIRSR